MWSTATAVNARRAERVALRRMQFGCRQLERPGRLRDWLPRVLLPPREFLDTGLFEQTPEDILEIGFYLYSGYVKGAGPSGLSLYVDAIP